MIICDNVENFGVSENSKLIDGWSLVKKLG